MPHFLDPHMYSFASAEFWVLIGLVIFFGILGLAGVHKFVGAALDAKAARIQSELDEAARLRAEAEALLAQIRQEKVEAETQAAAMLAQAETEARRLEEDARARLEESLARRQQMAERKIGQAEAQAAADVRAAAADVASQAAETILAARLAAQTSDPMVEAAIAQIADRLN